MDSESQILNIKATSSINTRKFQNTVVIPAYPTGVSATYIALQSTYGVDPANPYFYIFASGNAGQNSGGSINNGVGVGTTFEFLQGGTVQNQETLWWGNEAVLDQAGIFPENFLLNVVLYSPYLYGHDPVTGACPYSGSPGLSVQSGICTRWTALADQVRVTSRIYKNTGLVGPTSYSFTLCHGLLQQPFI